MAAEIRELEEVNISLSRGTISSAAAHRLAMMCYLLTMTTAMTIWDLGAGDGFFLCLLLFRFGLECQQAGQQEWHFASGLGVEWLESRVNASNATLEELQILGSSTEMDLIRLKKIGKNSQVL